MRLVDVLVLNYLDAGSSLSEAVKRSIEDGNIDRLFDTKRYRTVVELCLRHDIPVSTIIGFTRNVKNNPILESCRSALVGDVSEMSAVGVSAIRNPSSFGRNTRVVCISNLNKIYDLLDYLNERAEASGKAPWERPCNSSVCILSDGIALFLDKRYGWYHNDTTGRSSVIENRILPMVNQRWDHITRNDWQTLFASGAVKPATKVKTGANTYEFTERYSQPPKIPPRTSK